MPAATSGGMRASIAVTAYGKDTTAPQRLRWPDRRRAVLRHAARHRAVRFAVPVVIGVLPLVALVVALTASATGAHAATGHAVDNSVSFLRRDYDLQIQPNGDVAVSERWQVHFTGGPYTSATVGVFLTNTESVDFDHVVGADPNSEQVAKVEDPQGHPIEKISWTFPAAQDETRAFTIPYTLHAAVGQNQTQAWLDAHLFDGPGRGNFSVAATQVTVTLPAAAAGSDLQVRTAYPGAQLQTSRPSGTTVAVHGQNLSSGQLLEVAVIFPRSQLDAATAKPAWQHTDTPPNPPTALQAATADVTGDAPGDSGTNGLLGNVGLVLAIGLLILAALGFLVWRLSKRLSADIQELAAIKAGSGEAAPNGADGANGTDGLQATTQQLPAIDLNFGEVEWPTRNEEIDLKAMGLQPLETGRNGPISRVGQYEDEPKDEPEDGERNGHRGPETSRGSGATSGVGGEGT